MRNFNSEHHAQVRGTKILSAKSWYMDHIIREKIQSKLRLTVNIEDGLTFGRSLKPHTHSSKQQRKPSCYYMQLKHDGHFKGQQIQTLLPPTASLSVHSSGIIYPWPFPLHKTTPPTDSLHQSWTCSFPTQHKHFFQAAYSSLTTLKVKAANSSKTSVTNWRLTWHDIPEYFCHHGQHWVSNDTNFYFF